MKNLQQFAIITSLLLFSSSLAPGLVLIGEDFDGSDATNLNGKTPTTLDSSLSGATWTAPVPDPDEAPYQYERNGDIVANNSTTWVSVGSLINDSKGDADAIYTVTGTFTDAPATGSWFALGFYTTPGLAVQGNNELEAGILFRDDGDLEGWSDNDGNIVAADFAENITTEEISVELDLSNWDNVTNFGVITFSAGSDSATHNLTQDFSWENVGFGTSSGVTGKITSFELSQVPEPGATAFILGGLGVLLLLRQRRSLI